MSICFSNLIVTLLCYCFISVYISALNAIKLASITFDMLKDCRSHWFIYLISRIAHVNCNIYMKSLTYVHVVPHYFSNPDTVYFKCKFIYIIYRRSLSIPMVVPFSNNLPFFPIFARFFPFPSLLPNNIQFNL